MRWAVGAGVVLALGGCSTAQEIRRPDGRVEYLISCGSGGGWNVCYAEANKRCPAGYETVAETTDVKRKELRISCPPGPA